MGRWPPIVVAVLMSVAVAVRGPLLVPDSASYLDYSPMRTAGYPLFLDVMRVAGATAGLRLAVFVQALALLVTIGHFTRVLGSRLGLNRLPRVIAGSIFLPGWFACAGTIGSEALAWSFFLVGVAFGVDALLTPSDRDVFWSTVGIVGATLVRPQFMFALPVWSLGIAIHIFRRHGVTGALRVLVSSAAILVASGLLQRAYDYAKTGHAQHASLAGIQVATEGFYLSTSADASAVLPEDAAFVRSVTDRLAAQHMLASDHPAAYSEAVYFPLVYNEICWQAIAGTYRDGQGALVSVSDWRRFDEITLRVGVRLIRRHLVQYIAHVASSALLYAHYSLFMVMALVALALAQLRRADAVLSIGLWLALLWLANLAVICMVETPQSRYTVYTDSVLCAWIVAVIGSRTAAYRRVEA
jgi:hypothetical protein